MILPSSAGLRHRERRSDRRSPRYPRPCAPRSCSMSGLWHAQSRGAQPLRSPSCRSAEPRSAGDAAPTRPTLLLPPSHLPPPHLRRAAATADTPTSPTDAPPRAGPDPDRPCSGRADRCTSDRSPGNADQPRYDAAPPASPPAAKADPPRAIGIDDWAIRKGQTYGTLVVDLERRCPVDLLPDRSALTVTAWLRRHPGVQICDLRSSWQRGRTRIRTDYCDSTS